MDNRTFPEVDFVETDTEAVFNEVVAEYELRTGRTLYPSDPIMLLCRWAAALETGIRVKINQAAKQNVPRYAMDEFLDSLAELFYGMSRLPGEASRCTMRVYFSVPLNSKIAINAGTRFTVSGKYYFATEKTIVVPSGAKQADVEVACTELGTASNGFAPGQINQLVDVSNIDFYASCESTTETTGGADRETNEAFYDRMRQSTGAYSVAGPRQAYEYYAKQASAAVADVAASSPEDFVVEIAVLLQDGEIPSSELLAKIEEHLNGDEIRPLTDQVRVKAPTAVPFDVNLKYYISTPNAASSKVIQSQVQAAVDQYIEWQSTQMGRDINPSQLIAMVMDAGVKRVEVIAPAYRVLGESEVAQIGTKTAEFGGVEDD